MPKNFLFVLFPVTLSFVMSHLAFSQAPPCVARQELTARAQGIVSRYLVSSGTRVKKRQIIVEFDSRLLRAAVKEAKAMLDAAAGNEELAMDASKRFEKLKGSEAVTEQQIVESRIKVRQAGAAKRQADAALDRFKVQLEDSSIRAEVDGIVRGLPSVLGLPVQVGQSLGSIETEVCAEDGSKK